MWSSSYLVLRADASEEMKEAVIKVMNYQFDMDQDQGVSLKSDPTDPYSWTSMPFTLLLSTYTDKEGKAEGALKAFRGEIDPEELTGESAQWYESYALAETDIDAAIAASKISGWAYVRGLQPLVEGDEIMNKVFSATYAKTDTMDSKWATLEKLEDEFFLQYLNGDVEIDKFDDYVAQWNELGGATITEELSALIQ